MRNMAPPNTASMLSSGIEEFTPSTLPRFVSSVMSVIHALKALSLAKLPKNVMMQSNTTVSVMPSAAAAAASRASACEIFCSTANAQMETPHSSVPTTTNTLRRPTRSDHTPASSVVAVAVMAEALTMSATSEREAPNTSWMNRLKKLFSTAHATCPISDSITMRNHVLRGSFVETDLPIIAPIFKRNAGSGPEPHPTTCTGREEPRPCQALAPSPPSIPPMRQTPQTT